MQVHYPEKVSQKTMKNFRCIVYITSAIFFLMLGTAIPAGAQRSQSQATAAANDTHLGNVEDGRRVYNVYCARCHGPNMELTGTSTYDLRRFPAEQTDRFIRSVTKGKNSMPAWGSILNEDEIANLWTYVMTAKVQ